LPAGDQADAQELVLAAPLNPRAFVTHRRDVSSLDAALQRRTVISVQFRWTPVSSDHQLTDEGWYEIPVTVNNHVSANHRVAGNSRKPSLTIRNVRLNDIFSFVVRARCYSFTNSFDVAFIYFIPISSFKNSIL